MEMFVNRVIAFVIFCLFSVISAAQDHTLVWQKSIGSAGEDNIADIVIDQNDNIYVLGSIQGENGLNDIYLMHLNSSGQLLWSNTYGGLGEDVGTALLTKQDGGVLVLGSTNSIDGFNPIAKGYEDIVVLDIDQNGAVLDKHFYGGSFIDLPADIIESTNGYVIAASSWSSDGDLDTNYGQFDIWIFEIDHTGGILWQNTYGSTDEDIAKKVLRTSSGGYHILGQSTSSVDMFSDNHGDLDIVVIKTDSGGKPSWFKSYGGFYDDRAADFIQLENDNIVIAGHTFSNEFDVMDNHGGSDAWLLEIDEYSEIVWSKTYGSYGNEYVASLEETNSGYMLFGTSNSSSINLSINNGAQDFWLYEIEAVTHEIIDQSLLGASGFESGNASVILTDGSILLGGNTNSSDGVIQNNEGKTDGWVIRVQREFGSDPLKVHAHPNPSTGVFYLNNLEENSVLNLFDPNGKQLDLYQIVNTYAGIIDLSNYESGIYMLQIISGSGSQIVRLSKN